MFVTYFYLKLKPVWLVDLSFFKGQIKKKKHNTRGPVLVLYRIRTTAVSHAYN